MSSKSKISITVDTVVFGYDPNDGVSVLLIKRKNQPFKGKWALPGGFVDANESLEAAAARELKEETGISPGYMQQLHAFGDPKRDPRGHVVSVVYLCLVRQSEVAAIAGDDAADTQWFKVSKLPALAFDHREILKMAVANLRNMISSHPVAFHLLDEKFLFSELHNLYELVRGVEIDRRNFKKKLGSLDIVKELNEVVVGGRGRPGTLYRFDEKKFKKLMTKGGQFSL